MEGLAITAALNLLLTVAATVTADSCTANFVSQSDIFFAVSGQEEGMGGAMGMMGKKKKKGMQDLHERDKQQSLFVHQMFNCSGKLTSWIFAAKWEKADNRMKYPELQVWRALSAGSNTYNRISSTIVSTITSKSMNSIYTFDLDTPLEVQKGDVLGVYQPEKRKSKLVLYFQESGESIYSYFYKDKTAASIEHMTTGGNGIKSRIEKPLISAVIERHQTSSTISPSPFIATTKTTPPITTSTSVSSRSTVATPSHTTLTTGTTTLTLLPQATHFSTHPCSSSTFSSAATLCKAGTSTAIHGSSVTTTVRSVDQTHSLSHTRSRGIVFIQPTGGIISTTTSIPYTRSTDSVHSASITSYYTMISAAETNAIDQTYPVSCESEESEDLGLASSCLQMAGAGISGDGVDGTITVIAVILVVLFAAIFIFGMMVITICALCVVFILFRRKNRDTEMEMMSYPARSKPNRYIKTSVSSPMYEGVAASNRDPGTLPPTQPPATATTPGGATSSVASMDSSCPSVTVQPDVIMNVRGCYAYDHLVKGKSGSEKSNSSIVSPYEMPMVPDETPALPSRNIPIGFYDLADAIYVPTEDQRLKIEEKNDPEQDSLYKSLYKVQHETSESSNDISEHPEFFKETQEYWKPSYSKHAIYQQLSSRRFREVPRHKIQVIEYLGSGQFATVNKAMWRMTGGDVEVAVKMIREGAPEEEKIKFLQEAAINGQFHHLNVVRLLGVVTVGEPIMIILELLRNGNLKKFLISKRPKKGDLVSPDLPALLLNFSKQISSGMEYLAKKTFVHRDVAARNVLISDQLICKVADFGMSRDLEDNSYYVSQGGLVPIKWTAPEALYYRKYSTASDVWSYGVLLFEIWSLGKKPFSAITNEQYIEEIDDGKRLTPPPGCPRLLYQLMIDCWHPEPSERPSFSDIYQYFHSSPQTVLLLLGIADDELVEAPDCGVLGSSLENSQSLFMDLQSKYLE